MRLLSRPVALLPVLLGLLLAVALVPALASPARAATVVVTGKVTGLDTSGATVPVQDVFVEASDANGAPLEPDRVYDYTAADGTYELTLPATGSYRIDMECWGTYACAADYAPEPTITRTVTAATVVNATLERWGRITGTVKKDGVATAWPAGRITADNDARGYWSSEYPGVTVDGAGRFTIGKVAPGTVTLRGTEGYDVENFLSIVDGQTFAVAPGATSDISLGVEDWPGVYVRAVDPTNGAPLSGLGWQLYSRPVGGAWDDGLQMGPLLTDGNGRMSYRIGDKSREYTVCFYDRRTEVPADQRRLTRCLGNAPDLAGATAWKHSAAQPKLKADVALPLAFTTVPTPTISGAAKVGSTLTASAGTWVPAATTTSYQWLRAGVAINGATGATYALAAEDAGKQVSVKVTGARAGYATASATSVATAAVATGTFTTVPTPTISGTAKVGSTLTASAGAWVPAATSTTYEWLRGGVAINGATGSTYTLAAEDAGKQVSVKVTGARAGYTTASATSAATAAVAPGTFTTVPTPIISGTAKVGSTLSAGVGSWVPSATSTSYQWLRAGAEIPGATGASYVLVATDAGKQISVRVTGARAGYTPASRTSAATPAAAEGAFVTVPVPTITGTAAVGSTLTADVGTWVPAATGTTYQWLRSGVAVPGATGATYEVSADDAGATLTVVVTGARDGYAPAEARSAATTPVGAAAFVATPAPKVKGKARVGSRLKVVSGTWSPVPTTTTYQWYRNGKLIKGATTATYKVKKADRRKRITVVVTQARPGYATVSVTSGATKRIR